MSVVVAVVAAPWGPIHLAANELGVIAAETVSDGPGLRARLERRWGRVESLGSRLTGPAAEQARRAAAAVERYLGGAPDGATAVSGVAIDLAGSAPFDREVLAAVRSIPFGRVTSYGRLAAMVGRPGAARAVGGAVGRNPVGLFVPCHRVIAGDGSLGGYGGDAWGSRERALAVKGRLLDLEGVRLPVPRDRLLGHADDQ